MNDLWFEMEEQYFESTKGIGTLGIMGWKNDFEVFFLLTQLVLFCWGGLHI